MKCWTLRIAVLVPFLVVGLARAADDKAGHRNVGPDEFERLAKMPDAVVLDVRSPKEYATGHLKGAMLIDWNGKDFEPKVKALDRGKTYLVHCAVGGRSAKASEKLDGWGFSKVVNLEGGIKAWEKAGKPVEK
jgi:rhodanese-related sulfurtransferase